jgi:NADPH-dependent 2,4-dienoyl-CoA reductase/sulfur reductase-like enzyme
LSVRVVIVGSNDAGISAGLAARQHDPTAEVTLLVADAYPNFSICGLPYHVSATSPTGATSPTAAPPTSKPPS